MSAVAEQASVTLVVSDFANTDAAGKLNVLGATVAVLGFDPMQALSSRFSLAVVVRVPGRLLPAEFTVEVALRSGGELVQLPGPAGETQPLRISQVVSLDRLGADRVPSPAVRDHVGASHTMVLDFNTGLPLVPGGLYEWQVRIDGDDSEVHAYPFAVVGPPPPPVFG